MKKTISTILSLFILTSCGIPDAERVELATLFGAPAQSNDYANQAMGEYAVEISLEHFQKMREAQEDFLLYISKDDCAACQISGKALREYIAKTKMLIYYLDITENSIATEFVSVIANEYSIIGTPTLLFFINGKIAYDYIGADRLDTFYKVNNLISGYTKKVPVSYVFTTDYLTDLIQAGHHVFFLDYTFAFASKLYRDIKPLITAYDNFYFIDWQYFDVATQLGIRETYHVDLTFGASLIYWNEDNQSTILNFNNENSADFSTLLNEQ